MFFIKRRESCSTSTWSGIAGQKMGKKAKLGNERGERERERERLQRPQRPHTKKESERKEAPVRLGLSLL
jgi:hypothetical protein